jgi:hypothetical protein
MPIVTDITYNRKGITLKLFFSFLEMSTYFDLKHDVRCDMVLQARHFVRCAKMVNILKRCGNYKVVQI